MSLPNRVYRILEAARDSLADPSKQRWSDQRLLRILDEGQKDLARETCILKGECRVHLVPNKSIYNLPSDVWLLTRATFNNTLLQFVSYNNMDAKFGDAWTSHISNSITALVYSKRNMQEVRIYPTPKADMFSEEEQLSSLYGVTVEYDDIPAIPTFGVVSGVLETSNSVDSFGVVSGLYNVTSDLNILYIRDPVDIDDGMHDLEVPKIFDIALKYYVVGMAFSDDLDTQYQQKSAMSLQMYSRQLESIGKKTNLADGTRANQYRKGYISVFED